MLAQLRKTHEVAVYQFNSSLDRDRMMLLAKKGAKSEEGEDTPTTDKADKAEKTDKTAKADKSDKGDKAETADGKKTVEQWVKFLTPAGTETRLGEALAQLLHDQQNKPLSGVLLVSDGGQNAGMGPEAAIELAREAKLPIYTVGIGSNKKPISVRVHDLVAPGAGSLWTQRRRGR